MLASLRGRFTLRLASWARKRQGLDVTPLVLRARRLYILPTRAGLAFGLLLLVMLIAGLNYTNSLALLLTFVIGGFILVGMHECQRTLQGLELVQADIADCYAGDEGVVELHYVNPTAAPKRALQVRCGSERATAFELAPGALLTVPVNFQAPHRGRHPLPRLELASTAPFGLFRCWTWLHLPLEFLVYPQPAGSRPLPRALARVVGQARATAPGEDQWASLRPYQSGDNLRSIAWKAVARGAPLMVGQYEGAGGADHVLSFVGLEALELEIRLSQVCAWAQTCARLNAASALRLPGVELPLGRGAAHHMALLRALALYGVESP